MEKSYKLIIFDVDNTLTTTKSGNTFRANAADWQWLLGRLDALRYLTVETVETQVAVASNQGGVAFGHMREADLTRELRRMCEEGGIPQELLFTCFNHPTASIEKYKREDPRRKPGAGMLIEAMAACHVEPGQTLMVGDREEDLAAAINADVDFKWTNEFFPEFFPEEGHPF